MGWSRYWHLYCTGIVPFTRLLLVIVYRHVVSSSHWRFYAPFTGFNAFLEGIVATLSLAKSGIDGKCKNRRTTADGFWIFLLCLRFFIKCSKTAVLRGNRQEMPKICGDLLGDRPRGLLASCLLKTWWEMRSWGLHCYLGISQSVSVPPRALLKRSLKTLWAFP